MSQKPERVTCTSCKEKVPGYKGVYLTLKNKQNFYCDKCYNLKITEMYDFDFTNISFYPVTFSDSDGIDHTFYISTRIYGLHVALEAYELENDQPAGYKFSVMGYVEEDSHYSPNWLTGFNVNYPSSILSLRTFTDIRSLTTIQ